MEEKFRVKCSLILLSPWGGESHVEKFVYSTDLQLWMAKFEDIKYQNISKS